MFVDNVTLDTLINKNRVPRYFGLLVRASYPSSDLIYYHNQLVL